MEGVAQESYFPSARGTPGPVPRSNARKELACQRMEGGKDAEGGLGVRPRPPVADGRLCGSRGIAKRGKSRPDEGSPLINDAFHSRGSSKVREATYLGMLFTRSAKPVSSVMVGQALARPS